MLKQGSHRFLFFNDDANYDSQAKALTLCDDDPLWRLAERCCDWCFRIFHRAQEPVMMPASVDDKDVDDDGDDNDSVCASGCALSSV